VRPIETNYQQAASGLEKGGVGTMRIPGKVAISTGCAGSQVSKKRVFLQPKERVSSSSIGW
jgi:hypothetical protein